MFCEDGLGGEKDNDELVKNNAARICSNLTTLHAQEEFNTNNKQRTDKNEGLHVDLHLLTTENDCFHHGNDGGDNYEHVIRDSVDVKAYYYSELAEESYIHLAQSSTDSCGYATIVSDKKDYLQLINDEIGDSQQVANNKGDCSMQVASTNSDCSLQMAVKNSDSSLYASNKNSDHFLQVADNNSAYLQPISDEQCTCTIIAADKTLLQVKCLLWITLSIA